ncbi:MAG TPA: flagellar motor protein MotB [Planctomycetota bacterium]|nr:flagellar motor protein MotB [Planctomycetota bacterium]
MRTAETPGRRKRHPLLPGRASRPEKDESEVRWLISYSDFMMQLVCLFILLYSVSSVDTSKAVPLAQAWRDETGLGEVKLPSTGRTPNVPLTSSELTTIIHEVQIMAGRHPGGDSLRLVRSTDGFKLQLAYGMFERGGDRLDAQGIAAADLVQDLLHPLQERVESVAVVGHASTDEPGPLELSLNRAAAMLRRLTREDAPRRLTGELLIAAGRGAHDPMADPGEETGRRLNRRVEFVVRLKPGS